MNYLTLDEVFRLHDLLIARSGGKVGIHDLRLIESAVAQPRMTFDGVDLYPSLIEKASAIGYSLACNHGFVDGSKRIGQIALEAMLVLNGYELDSDVDDQERVFLQLADKKLDRDAFVEWVGQHAVPLIGKSNGP